MHEQRMRAREAGVEIGTLPTGPNNAITDVEGVRVGHKTVWRGEPGGDGPVSRTGVTAIVPPGNITRERLYAGVSVFNGYGELTGKMVIDEWGLLGSPILLTNTMSVGSVYRAAVAYMARQSADAHLYGDVEIPVVGECYDGFLNDDIAMTITEEDVFEALDTAAGGPVTEGAVGAGAGMALFGFKGGIGTSSRVVDIHGRRFTVGVLLLTNYGLRSRLTIGGVPVGRMITDLMPERPELQDGGSCIGVVATDAPLHPLQLRRLARRVDVGLSRTGSVANEGSGEIFMAFSTANRIPVFTEQSSSRIEVLLEAAYSPKGTTLDPLFHAVADATEEAAINALFTAVTVTGRDGHVLHALPIERTLEILRTWRAIQDGPQ